MARRFLAVLQSTAFPWIVLVSFVAAIAATGVSVLALDVGELPSPLLLWVAAGCVVLTLLGAWMVWLRVGVLAGIPLPRTRGKWLAVVLARQVGFVAALSAALVGVVAVFGSLAQLFLLPLAGLKTTAAVVAVFAQLAIVAVAPVVLVAFLARPMGLGRDRLRDMLAAGKPLLAPFALLSLLAFALSHVLNVLIGLVSTEDPSLVFGVVLNACVGIAWMTAAIAVALRWKEGRCRGMGGFAGGARGRWGELAGKVTACFVSFVLAFGLFGSVSPAEAAELQPGAPSFREGAFSGVPDGEEHSKGGEPDPEPEGLSAQLPIDYYGEEELPGDPVAIDGEETLFRTSEKKYTTVVGGRDLAYTDESGDVKPIDNTLVDEGGSYVNESNSFSARLPREIADGRGIVLKKGLHTIEMLPLGGDFSRSAVEGNAIRYTEVQDGIDYQYTLVGSLVKEDIVLNREVEPRTFRTKLKLSAGLDVSMEEGIAVVRDAEGEEVISIGAPSMEDAAGEPCDELELSVAREDDGPVLELNVNWDWVRAPERAYPVRVDPTTDMAPSRMRVVCVEQSWPDLVIGENGYSYAGYDDGKVSGTGDYNSGVGHGICRLYAAIGGDFNYILTDARIDSAHFSLYQYTTFSKGKTKLGLFRVTSPWNVDGLTWNKQTGLGHEFIQYQNTRRSVGYVSWDIREAVNNWVQGIVPQRGFCVKAENERWMQCEVFMNRFQAHPPKLEVNWTIPDPVKENYSLDKTTVNLHPVVETSVDGLQALDGVVADGVATPRSTVAWELEPSGISGSSSASRSYKYPDSSPWEKVFPKGTKYRDKLSNWQSGLFTKLSKNKIYHVSAQPSLSGKKGKRANSDKFLVYKAKVTDTLPYIAKHYGVPLNTLAADNRVQDSLSIKGNTLFVRKPKTAVAYAPKNLSTDQKKRIDSALMGRGKHCEYGFEPINLNTGNYAMEATDATIPELEGDFSLTRSYNSKMADQPGSFGFGWSFAWDGTLSFLDADTIVYRAGDGKVLYFDRKADKTYACALDPSMTIVPESFTKDMKDEKGKKVKKKLTRWRLKHREGGSELFNEWGMLASSTSQLGLTTTVNRDKDQLITSVVSPSGLSYGIAHDAQGRIKGVTLPGGASLSYKYDENGNLISLTDANGKLSRYKYDASHLMTSWTDPDGNRVVENVYDAQGRVMSQKDAEGNVSRLSYSNDATTATDALGNRTVYHVDGRMRTTRIDYPDGTSVSRAYDAAGNLASDEDGSYSYDASGNLLSSKSPDGLATSYGYDSSNRLVSQVNPDGERISYAYDAAGNLASRRSSSGESWAFSYDSAHRLVRATDADGVTTSYSYSGPWVASETDALGNRTAFAYDAMGRRVSETGPTGATKRTTYDRMGNVTGETDGAGGHVSYELTAAGRVKAIVDARGFRTAVGYDKRGNVASLTDAAGKVESYSYDAVGNRVSHSDAAGGVERFSYDPRGRLASEQGTDGSTRRYSHDAKGNVTKVVEADGSSYSYAYDRTYGNPVSATDALGNASRLEYDAAGRLTAVFDPLGNRTSWSYGAEGRLASVTDATGAITTYEYTPAGRLSAIDESGRRQAIGHDAAGRVIMLTDAAGGQWKARLDGAGNVLEEVDPLGNAVRHTYDGAGRETSRTDAEGGTVRMSYDAAGNLTEVVDERGGRTVYAYDAFNQVTAVTDPLGNVSALERDVLGRATAKVDARGFRTKMRYDAAGRLVEQIDPLGNSTSYSYDPRGNLTAVTDPNGNVEERSYDGNGDLESVTDATGLRTLLTRDEAGNVTAVQDDAGRAWRFGYDGAGRLTSSADPLGRVTLTERDAWGDVARETGPDGSATSYERDALGNVTSATDALGGVTSFSYDAAGNLSKRVDANGGVTACQRDKAGRVVGVLDAEGGFWSYVRDASGNVVGEVDGDGNRTSRKFDAAGNQTAETDGLGHVTRYSYDASGNLVTSLSPESVLTSFSYDGNGRLTSRRDGAGGTVSYSYDALGNLASTTDALGSTTGFARDALGRMTSRTDALGNVTEYSYDKAGNLASIAGPRGEAYSFSHDAAGQMTSASTPIGREVAVAYDAAGNVACVADNLGMKRTFEHDALGRLTVATDSFGSSQTWGYDPIGNVISHTDAAGDAAAFSYDRLSRLVSAADGSGGVSRYSYDARGNLVKATSPGGRSFEFAYDAAGNLRSRADAQGNERVWEYDADGRVTAAIDAAGRSESYVYDGVDRIISMQLSGGDGSAGATTRNWTYDAAGNVTAASDARGNATSYAYDQIGRLASVTDAAGAETRYSYDASGNLEKMLDARGNATSYSHDAAGNLTGVVSPSGMTESLSRDAAGRVTSYANGAGEAVNYAYDAEGRLERKSYPGSDEPDVAYSYDSRGMVKSRSDWTGQSAREYDALGLVAFEADGAGNKLAYSYDADGNIEKVTYPDGSAVSYEYDASGYLTSLSTGGGEWKFENDPEGRATSVERPDGSKTAWERDALGRVSAVRNLDSAGDAVATYEYERDEDGRIVRESSDVNGIGKAVRAFSYDACGRLASCSVNEGTGKSLEEYAYDGTGNRTSVKRSGARGSSKVDYEYDGDNRLVKAISGGKVTKYAYDDAGNLASKSGPGGDWEFSFGVEGRLKAVSEGGAVVLAAAYDGDGNRVWQQNLYTVVNGTEKPFGEPGAPGADASDGLVGLGTSSVFPIEGSNGWGSDGASDESDEGEAGTSLLAYSAAQGLAAAIGPINPAASASLSQALLAKWFDAGERAPSFDEGVRDMAVRALKGAWGGDVGIAAGAGGDGSVGVSGVAPGEPVSGSLAGSETEKRTVETAYVNTTLTDVAQPMCESGGLDGDADNVYLLTDAGTGLPAVDLPAISNDAPVPQASDPAVDAAAQAAAPVAGDFMPQLADPGSCASAPRQTSEPAWCCAPNRTTPCNEPSLLSGPASTQAGLSAPASLGANAGALSATRLATASSAGCTSFGWDARGSATVSLGPSGSLAASFAFGVTGLVDSGDAGELPTVGWDGEELSPSAGLVFLRARWLLASEGSFASADLWLGAAGTPSTLNRHAFGLGDPVNRFDPSGRDPVGFFLGRRDPIVNAERPSLASRLTSTIATTMRVTGPIAQRAAAASQEGRDEVCAQAYEQAARVAARIAAFYCGAASYMAKRAPQPSGISPAVAMMLAGRVALAVAPKAFVAIHSPVARTYYQIVGLSHMPKEYKDPVHMMFDVVGLVPLVGEAFDATNAMWYAYEGDHVNAALSGAALAPVVGIGSTAAKLGKDAIKLGGDAAAAGKAAGALEDSAKIAGKGRSPIKVKVSGRGSTGRTKARNLNEQLYMRAVKSNPLAGAKETPIKLRDPRWPSKEGWVKMQRTKTFSDGTTVNIHFLYNKKTKEFDDFKFKDR